MSETVQWIIVAAIVAAAVVFLARRLKPSKKNPCAGCPYAGSCGAAKDGPDKCPTPERRS